MNSKFCGKCGAPNEAQMLFCSQCGERFESHEPVNNYDQPAPAAFQPPNYAPQAAFQPPPANSFPADQSSFQPTNFSGANNFNAPAAAFQPPPFQQELQSPAFSNPDKKSGIGSKIGSVLTVLLVGIIMLLKFGFVLSRAARLGGVWLVGIIFIVIVVVGVFSFIRKR